MNRIIPLLLLALVPRLMAASLADRGMVLDCRALSIGNPSFTDIGAYNSRDFAGSPIGLLEAESAQVKVDVGYRHYDTHLNEEPDSMMRKINSAAIPRLLMGLPGTAYFSLWYTPDIIAQDVAGEQYDLTLQRFGLEIAGGVPTGIFRVGLRGEGYVGTEFRKVNENERTILGVQDVGLFLGSQVHEFVRIGFDAHATAHYDSLRDVEAQRLNSPLLEEDRYYSGQIPRIGGNIDFGAKGFPVLSNFQFEKGVNRFIYVTKHYGFGINGKDEGNEDAITSDSIRWKWQTMVDFSAGPVQCRPAFKLGYWSADHQQYEPDSKNDNPLKYGLERKDATWQTSSFDFGIGGDVGYGTYGSGDIEFQYSKMALAFGDGFPTAKDEDDGYVRFQIGAEGNIHAIPALRFPASIELKLRLGYSFAQLNSLLDPYREEEFSPLNPGFGSKSQYYRYAPTYPAQTNDTGLTWGSTQTVSRFSFGLGSSFNKTVGLDLFLAFPRLTVDKIKTDGFEFGANLTYNLFQPGSMERPPVEKAPSDSTGK